MNPEPTFADAKARFEAHRADCLQCRAFPLAPCDQGKENLKNAAVAFNRPTAARQTSKRRAQVAEAKQIMLF